MVLRDGQIVRPVAQEGSEVLEARNGSESLVAEQSKSLFRALREARGRRGRASQTLRASLEEASSVQERDSGDRCGLDLGYAEIREGEGEEGVVRVGTQCGQ